MTSLLAAARVKSNYLRFARVAASSGLTGTEAALEILRHANIDDVEVIPHDGLLADHYDPLHKRGVVHGQLFWPLGGGTRRGGA